MLVKAQEAGQILDEEQLAFLADPRISEAQVAQQIIPHNSAFQTDDLDAYDSDCEDLSSAKAVLMANLSSYDPEVLSELFSIEIDTLKETLSNNVKEKESLSKTLIVFQIEYKEKESNVIAKEHAVIYVIDDEETLILEEECRSKMPDKQNDPISIEKKIKISPIDYSKLNKIKEYFGKHFVTQKELSAEQAFWLKIRPFPKHLLCHIHLLESKLLANFRRLVVSKPNATIAPGRFKLDIEPISPRLKNNRDAHEVYIKKTIEYIDTLCGFVERAITQYLSEPLLESACMFTKHVQKLLVYASHTCPNSPKPSEKLVAVTSINKDKRVRFAKLVTSLINIPKQTDSLKTKDSNKPLLTSTGVKPTTSVY
ncbi:hypothetical protein Tco_0089599 [Tanacetum coccineum]